MTLGLLLSALAAIASTAESYCYSTSISASTTKNTRYVYASAYDNCVFTIRPASYYSSSSYYLEISWSSSYFDVKGNMPFCKEDYVEVFLTSGYTSIGKFCSSNAGKPFTMYSWDGHAKIVFSTNGYATSSGFTLYYQLKSKYSYPLGASSSSSICYNTYNYGDNGMIYSTGWPYNYKGSSSSCNYRIFKSYGYQGIYVVFMDINLYSSYSYYYRDCVQLSGSNISTSYYEKTISPSLCGTTSIKSYSTYSKHLKIRFDRSYKQTYSSSFRGFVAGYIMFRTPTALIGPTTHSPASSSTTSSTTKSANNPVDEPYSNNSSTVGIVLGVLIPIIIVVIIVVAVVVYTKTKRRPNAGAVNHTQPQNNTTVQTTQRSTVQQTSQALTPTSYTNHAFSQHQYFPPIASMQNGNYPSGAYPITYPTVPSYPTGQFTPAGITLPQYSCMVTPANTSIPNRALQPSLAPGVQGQPPAGTLYHAPPSSTNSGENAPFPMPSVEVSYNAPPPAY